MTDDLLPARVGVPVLLDGEKPFTLIPPGPRRIPCVSLCVAHGMEGWRHSCPADMAASTTAKFKSVVFQSLEHQRIAGYGHVIGVLGFEVNPELFPAL